MIPLTLKTFAALMAAWWLVSERGTLPVEMFTGAWGLLLLWFVACAKEIGEAWGWDD